MTRSKILRIAMAAGLLAAAILPAAATGTIVDLLTSADEKRLERFDEARTKGLAEARAGGSASDLATFEEVAGRPRLPIRDFDPSGDWQCRTIKAGGPASLVIYSWFRCRVGGDEWVLEKLSGSQRTTGRFFDESETSMTYVGVYHVAGTAAPEYGLGPQSDQVGRAFRTGSATWQIEFPFPTYESTFDILEFRR